MGTIALINLDWAMGQQKSWWVGILQGVAIAGPLSLVGAVPALASPVLEIKPISWNVIGLDSNKPATSGPDVFNIGARVCNLGTGDATNLKVDFIRDGSNAYIANLGVTSFTIPLLPSGPTGASFHDIGNTGVVPSYCRDFYFNLQVTRDKDAFDTKLPYRISATATGLGTVYTPSNRELYIEKLVSQSRNDVVSFAGPTTVEVGRTYQYTISGETSTAYDQLVFATNFPNTIFQVLSVNSTYSTPAGSTNNSNYANGCRWQNDTTSSDYRSCVKDSSVPVDYPGGVGNTFTTTYLVRILSTGSASPVSLVYDESGSSYHYNSDYGEGETIRAIVSSATPLTTISGSAYRDLNFNSTLNSGEPSISSLTVRLYIDANNNNVIDFGEEAAEPIQTDANGQYTFTNIPSGNYKVKISTTDSDIPAGFSLGTANDRAVTVSTTPISNIDFGFIKSVDVSGTLYRDADRDNTLDSGETNLPANITVNLYNTSSTNNTPIKTTTTDSNGNYQFTNVADGNYWIQVNTGDADIPSALTIGTPNNLAITVAGNSITSQNFGFDEPGGAGAPFSCDGQFYQIRMVNNFSELFRIDRQGNAYQPTQLADLPDVALNGMAYNPKDNYLYAIFLGPSTNNPTGVSSTQALYRIGQNGAENLGGITGMANGFQPTAADFDRQGNLYVTEAGGSNKLYKIDVVNRTATLTTLNPATPNLGDMSLHPTDGLLYGVDSNKLYVINPSNGNVTTRTMSQSGSWGSSFMDPSGTFYIYDNGGGFYAVNLATGALSSIATAPTTSRSDGAVCTYPPQYLDVIKSTTGLTKIDPITFEVPYRIVVKNTGTAIAPNVQVTENLGLTFQSGSPTISLVSNTLTFTGPLTANPNFNGTTQTNLFVGSSSLNIGAQQSIDLTVRLVYPTVGAVPVLADNSAYASSTTTTANPGYSLVSGQMIPPVDLLAGDRSTNGTTLPTSPNGDTPSVTRVNFPVASQPSVLLVKRITRINNGTTAANGENLASYQDESTNPYDDNDPTLSPPTTPLDTDKWPNISSFLLGRTSGGTVYPGDEVEYTIYFLSTGSALAKNVVLCDRVPDKQTFIPTAYSSITAATGGINTLDRGMVLSLNGQTRSYTNLSDGDGARYYAPGETLPNACKASPSDPVPANPNGAIVVNLGDLPAAQTPGDPGNSYGFVRFRAKVK